ncbi:hypothetical protein [Desulforamulus aquiferis]|uniref:Uncharacterized protein n=1 Tax=Desulforamulus aquiferis TaxID=1397668 RepID=A0AAW7ZK03_9FIRM|nr:hypothetical protein [Desulforamulus aquiferis]MDO7789134.1 hypothetical protein [Desulforamulus aquiferis]
MSNVEPLVKCFRCCTPGKEVSREGIFANFVCPKCESRWQTIRPTESAVKRPEVGGVRKVLGM